MAQYSSSSDNWPVDRPSPTVVRKIFPEPHNIQTPDLFPYLLPADVLSQRKPKETIKQLEVYNPGKMRSMVVPICTLAFLQYSKNLFKASVLLDTENETAQEVLVSRINQLNSAGLLEVFRSGMDGRLYVRIPETLKLELVEWTFTAKSYRDANLANAIFSQAVVMLENAGPIGNGYYLPTYDSFQSLINVYKTFRELVREDFQKTHGAPRLISAEVTVFFGKMILKKATDLLVGKHSTLEVPMTLVVERFLRMVEAHLLLWMRQAAGELRDVVDKAKEAVVGAHMDEAKRRILEHQQTYLEAAGAFEAQRIVLARSVMDLRAMRAASS